MLKFYIVKRAEREYDGYSRIMEFTDHNELERYLAYNRAYISEIKTLDTDSTYSFTDAEGVTVSDLEGVK
jgi:hypothetical protein